MTEVEKLREQLRQQQKIASLGMLSAGIAHEVQNPLNFVINFSKLSEKLLADMKEIVDDAKDKIGEEDAEELQDITDNLAMNMEKIREHGERAISIIQGILLISRGKDGELLPTDIAHLMHEYVWLSYHSQRANDKSFNITISEDYQDDMPRLMVIPQDLSRAVLNVLNNACYAIIERQKQENNSSYVPTIKASAKYSDGKLIIRISDNGVGIAPEIRERLFKETITTKPIGKGTGLGMQITWNIVVNAHHGEILVDSKVGEGTTFTFVIPTDAMK